MNNDKMFKLSGCTIILIILLIFVLLALSSSYIYDNVQQKETYINTSQGLISTSKATCSFHVLYNNHGNAMLTAKGKLISCDSKVEVIKNI